ncbi:hypothetical protein [Lacipirellula sp.]|uniref:hypothetical protein n=1 Tax=Lacipirellula sp. TaxID=2691419 RepID=UPI003D11B552
MNQFNTLVNAVRAHGGFATTEQLKAVRPKLKNIMALSVNAVDVGIAVWDESPDGVQELRLTEKALVMMAGPGAKAMTTEQLIAAINRGESLVGHTIVVTKR